MSRSGHDHERNLAEEPPLVTGGRDIGSLVAAAVAGAAAVVFAVALLAGTRPRVYGTALAVAAVMLAIAVRRYVALTYPRGEAVEPRHHDGDGGAGDEPLSEVAPVGREGIARRLVLAAAGLLGLSLLAPVSALGPRAGDRLRRTAWQAGSRLVTSDGALIRPSDVVEGSVVTAWPADAVGDERSAVIVIRLSGEQPRPPTNLDWVVDGSLIAYSKVCTHAGCPVGLFRVGGNALFCPCHQTTFDATHAAVPTFGPAVRALPQLPLGVDDDGRLTALGDFREQVGPPFGWLGR